MTAPADLPVAGNEDVPVKIAARVIRRSPALAALAAVFTTLPMPQVKRGVFTVFDKSNPETRAARREGHDKARSARAASAMSAAMAKRQARAEKRRRSLEVDAEAIAAREAEREAAYLASVESRRQRVEAKAQAKAAKRLRGRGGR